MAAAVQAAATQLLDLTVGSTLRAVLEANASVCLWMQWLILQVLRTTRAATSTGADLDSWMADLSLTPLLGQRHRDRDVLALHVDFVRLDTGRNTGSDRRWHSNFFLITHFPQSRNA